MLNRELGADFDIDAFSYVPFWDPRQERMDLRLRADMPQRVTIPGADLTFELAHGEEIRVEISTKFRPERLRDELGRGRLHRRAHVDRHRRRLRPHPRPARGLTLPNCPIERAIRPDELLFRSGGAEGAAVEGDVRLAILGVRVRHDVGDARMAPRTLYRRIALAEVVTWALLLLGMVLKYVTRTTELGVKVFGLAHGVVFIAFCLVTVLLWVNQRWTVREGLLGLLSAVPPFLTVWWERRLERRGRLEGGWRLGRDGETPTNPAERVVAALLARPMIAVAVGVVAVLALTGVALVVGPPVGPQG